MRLEDLRIFQILADSKSLHRAAHKAGLSQSAVTKILQRLEAEFGIRLVDRSKRGIDLTTAGQTLLRQATAMQHLLDETQAQMATARSAADGLVRFGTYHALIDMLALPPVIHKVREAHGVRFELMLQTSEILLRAVADGRLDLALCVTPNQVPADLHSDALGAQRFVFVASKSHAFCTQGIDATALASSKWLLQPKGYPMRDLVDDYLCRHGLPPAQVTVETDASTSLLAALVRQTDLLSIMTEQALASPLGQGIAPLDLTPAPLLSSHLGLYFRRNTSMSPVVARFRSQVLAYAQERHALPGAPSA